MKDDEQRVTIPVTKLRRELGVVIDEVIAGQIFHVERNGRPLVVLVPPTEYERLRGEG